MTTIHTTKGEYTGRSVDTIIRRVWGRNAEVRRSADPNNPNEGLIVTPVKGESAYNVHATLLWSE
jgi:hypothetical protein